MVGKGVTRDGDIKWVPVSTVTKLLGCSRQNVYQHIERGNLVSVRCGTTVLVSLRTVYGFLAERLDRR